MIVANSSSSKYRMKRQSVKIVSGYKMKRKQSRNKESDWVEWHGEIVPKCFGLKDVMALLDKSYELTYIDYRDSFEGNEKSIQSAIKAKDISVLYEDNDGWICDAEWESINYIMSNNLVNDMMDRFDLDRVQAQEYIEEHGQEIAEEIQSRNCSDPISDLLRHTRGLVALYETDLYVSAPCSSDDVKDSLRDIKRTLKIQAKNHEYDEKLRLMIQQSYCGGALVIYFIIEDAKDFINLNSKPKMINFSNPMVAIIDTVNGSGDNTDLRGWSFKLPYDSEKVYLDKCISYSYTYDVCGMSDGWCSCTDVSLTPTRAKPAVKSEGSVISNHIEQEAKYDKVYKAGGCTPGDMKMSRHRNTYYLNEYPCGTHCKDCGTFWIN